jgi:hypothetical protein
VGRDEISLADTRAALDHAHPCVLDAFERSTETMP